MSEISDLIAILGPIDRAVSVEDDGRRSQVANLVPAYRVGDRFGWYGRFVERSDIEGLPRLEDLEDEQGRVNAVRAAMANLAEPTRFASMLPRRLLAIALVVRMFDRFGPGGADVDDSLRALIVPGIVSGLPPVPTPPPDQPPATPGIDDEGLRERARRLLAALADPAQLERIEDWHEFLRSNADLVSTQLTRLPAPCATTVIEQPTPGDLGAIAVLETVMCVGGVDLATIEARFLDPARWPDCSPWWCAMDKANGPAVGTGLTRYLEVVAADCSSHLFEVAVFLDFATAVKAFDADGRPIRTVVTYNMSPDQHAVGGLHANDAVNIDRGVIEARQERGHVHVRTTKRVRFRQPIDSDALALIACWVGYGDVAADVICNCSGGQPVAVDCAVASSFTDAINRFVDLAHTCVTEAGQEARRVSNRLGSGTFSPGTAATDATRMVALAVRGWGKLTTTFIEAFGDVVSPPAQPSPLAAPLPSGPFSFDTALPVMCDLSLEEPMRSPYDDAYSPGHADEKVDTTRVVIGPAELGPGGREFRLTINISGLEGTAYTGEVVAKSRETPPTEVGRIPVDVIVP